MDLDMPHLSRVLLKQGLVYYLVNLPTSFLLSLCKSMLTPVFIIGRYSRQSGGSHFLPGSIVGLGWP